MSNNMTKIKLPPTCGEMDHKFVHHSLQSAMLGDRLFRFQASANMQ